MMLRRAIRRVTLACRSKVIAIGVGTDDVAQSCSNTPSASAWSTVVMAPCSASTMPSKGPWSERLEDGAHPHPRPLALPALEGAAQPATGTRSQSAFATWMTPLAPAWPAIASGTSSPNASTKSR